jgi:hypothetical protein
VLRSLGLIATAFALAAPVQAEPPRLERATIGAVSVLAPQGWSRSTRGSSIVLEGRSARIDIQPSAAPALDADYRAMSHKTVGRLGDAVRRITTSPDGSLATYEMIQAPIQIVLLKQRAPTPLVGSLTGTRDAIAALGGRAFLQRIARSASLSGAVPRARTVERAGQARRGPEVIGAVGPGGSRVMKEGATTAGAGPAGSIASRAALIGSWQVSAADSSWDGGSAVFSMTGSGMAYRFSGNGGYTASWSMSVSSGVLTSTSRFEENGRWSYANGRLLLDPARYDGFVSNFGNRVPSADRNPPSRSYRVFANGPRIVLRGPCAPYQMESSCRNPRTRAMRELDFPLRPRG